MRNTFLVFIIIFMHSNSSSQVTILEDSIPSGKNFKNASFRLWLQQDTRYVRGVVALMPGSNGDGRDWVMDSTWQNFAVHNNMALLGCYYTDNSHDNMDIEEYANVKEGSGKALLDVLAKFAQRTHHAELSNAPLFLWGISAGGEFNYEFACWKPERIAAFVVNKGGVYFTALCSPETRKVPGLFFTGEYDLEFRSEIIEGIFAINRRFGALWAFAEEPCIKHDIGQSKMLSILFFNDIIKMRMPAIEKESQTPFKLLHIKEEDGYVGDFKLKEYYAYKDWKGSYYPTAWLPGQGFAEAWLSLINGDCTENDAKR